MSEDTLTGLPLLTRGQLLDKLKAPVAKWEDVPVPAWGGALRIREVGADRRLDIEDAMLGSGAWAEKNLGERIAHLLRLTAIDEAGDSMLTDDDLAQVASRPPSVLLPIFRAICRVNSIGGEVAAAHAGESSAAPSGASPSA